MLKRLDELEALLAIVDTDFASLTSDIEEKVRDQVQGSLEDLVLPGAVSDDEMDEDIAEGNDSPDTRQLDDLVKEVKNQHGDIDDLRSFAVDTRDSATTRDGGIQECRDIAEELRAKKGTVSPQTTSVELVTKFSL